MSAALSRSEPSVRLPAPRFEPLYRSVIGLALLTFKVMDWRVSMEGTEHIPLDGHAVIASNHLSHLDFIFLGLAAHERHRLVRFMAIRSAFEHPVSGPLLRGMHHIPVDREQDPARAFDIAVDALHCGEVVGLHPEGRIRRSAVRLPWKTGAVRMARETGAPLIPAAVWGTQPFLRPGARRRFPRHIAVAVQLGPPLTVDTRMTLPDATTCLQDRIAELESRAAALPQPEDRFALGRVH
jgi:1-acyl-sn-glycerol-3-phosphate acyltransferase